MENKGCVDSWEMTTCQIETVINLTQQLGEVNRIFKIPTLSHFLITLKIAYW